MSRLRSILTAPFRYVAAAAGRLEDREAVLLVGLLILAAGLWLVWEPLALIVPGAILTGVALDLFSRKGGAS